VSTYQQPIPARGTPLSRLRLTILCLVSFAGIPLGLASASTDPSPKDKASAELVIKAKEAFLKGRLPELERLTARSQGTLLAAWPDYWRLRILLGTPSVDAADMRRQVQGFLSRHGQHPLAENAQRDWVHALVVKNLWDDAERALKTIPDTLVSPGLMCARGRLGLLNAENRDQLQQMLMSLPIGQETSDACIGLVDQLVRQGQVSMGYLRQRIRWAAQIGSDSSHDDLIDILKADRLLVETGGRGLDPLKSETQLGRILKTSRIDSQGAFVSLKRHGKELNEEQLDYARFAVGAALWRRSHPEAWPLMREGWASLAQQPDEILQIAAREAIRRSAWTALSQVIAAMRPATRAEPAWQYWQAVVFREQRTPEKADPLLRGLRDGFGFYGVLARELMGEPTIIPASAAIQLSDNDRQRLDRDPGMRRSYALVRAGLRGEAVAEWSAAMRGRTDTQLLQAALHAKQAGFYDRMIAAADRTRESHDFTLRFPTPFQDKVIPAAKERALDPWWVLGLIRQESRFIADIKSSVGASGLMQIMPATGKMLAKNVGLKPSAIRLTDVETNIRLGTTYMRQLHDRFGGSALLASAAYNAGPSRAISWRAALPRRIEGAAFAESIPFPETRDYVKHVLTNAVLYHAVHNGGKAPSLKQLLGDVMPGEPS
jgi:soluble lytic murein transglycosylase